MTPTDGLGACVTYKQRNIQRNVTANDQRESERERELELNVKEKLGK